MYPRKVGFSNIITILETSDVNRGHYIRVKDRYKYAVREESLESFNMDHLLPALITVCLQSLPINIKHITMFF